MDELVAQTIFFKAITEMTTDKVYKYIPDSDTRSEERRVGKEST